MKWKQAGIHDFFFYARSYRAAARKLARLLDLDPGPVPDFDLCPMLSAYRQAVELHLKAIVLAEGAHFLPEKPDPISVSKTRSLSWLAQFVSQIVTTLKWEAEFTAEGIGDLAGFREAIAEANSIDAQYPAFRFPRDPESPISARAAALAFVRRMETLIDLLESTADALAAEWNLRSQHRPSMPLPPGGKPTIH